MGGYLGGARGLIFVRYRTVPYGIGIFLLNGGVCKCVSEKEYSIEG